MVEEDNEDSDRSSTAPSSGRKDSRVRIPTGFIEPLEVRFSQPRASSCFRDGSPLDEAVKLIKAEAWAGPVPPQSQQLYTESRRVWRLTAPFPPIEVLRWRCKLRDKNGRPCIDPETGGELYDAEERLFTLDNRRLYCLQKVAVRLWPDRCLVEAVELPPCPMTSIRQLKKFRTADRGRSILIGDRSEGSSPCRWSWKVEADEEESDSGHKVQMRRRQRPAGAPKRVHEVQREDQDYTEDSAERGLDIGPESLQRMRKYLSEPGGFCLLLVVIVQVLRLVMRLAW